MRPHYAPLVVLGTAAITLGALACTHDLGTGPVSAGGPSYARATNAKSVIRSFRGKHDSFEIDHDQGTVTRQDGKKAKLDKAALAVIEKSFDALEAADGRVRALQKSKGFAEAMERASKNPRQLRMHVDTGGTAAGLRTPLAGGASASVAPGLERTFASPGGPCFDLEMLIYSGTNEYDQLREEYNNVLNDVATLGFGFDETGAWGWSPARYASQLASWSVRANLVAYRILVVRNTLDYLALQYQLYGCWNQPGSDGGGEGGGSANCRYTAGKVEAFIDGRWVVAWEGQIKVCEAAT